MKNWIVNEWKNENTKKVKIVLQTRMENERRIFFAKSREIWIKFKALRCDLKLFHLLQLSFFFFAFVLHSDTSLQSFCDFFIALYIFFCLMLLQMINEWHFFSSNERGRKMIIKMFFLLSSSLFWYLRQIHHMILKLFFSFISPH